MKYSLVLIRGPGDSWRQPHEDKGINADILQLALIKF